LPQHATPSYGAAAIALREFNELFYFEGFGDSHRATVSAFSSSNGSNALTRRRRDPDGWVLPYFKTNIVTGFARHESIHKNRIGTGACFSMRRPYYNGQSLILYAYYLLDHVIGK
jgi:hypothetical protein